MSKQLLIENCEFVTPIKIEKGLKESISIENNKDILIVRNIPATIADRKNQNGRIYTTEILQEAIKNANFQLKAKWLYSQASEHPEGSYVVPTHASHVVINAYIKKNVKVFVEGKTERHNVMFMDWEILNTEEGKNLKALILQETACPTSIRGLGDMEGEYVTNYELLGCDVVSNPSSGTSMRMPVSESVKVEKVDKSYLDESFEVVSVANDTVSDIEAAAQKQVDIENARYGTITNIKTKLDQEIDPKTHAETVITSIETTTTDEVSELDQALQMAKNAFTNPVSKMDSVTISFVDDEEKVKESKESKESNVADAPNSVEQIDAVAEETEPKKEFLDINAKIGDISDINVLGTQKLSKDDSETQEESTQSVGSIDQELIDGLSSAIKELNDKILREKDPENIKKLKLNRDELEKLLNKNKENQAKSSENSELKSNEDKSSKENELNSEKDKKQEEIEVQDNKLVAQLDDDTAVEKEFSDKETAEIAKAGLENGLLDPSFVVSEDATPNSQGGTDYTCTKATYDTNTGKFTCEDAQNEKLYSNPDEPSDALVNQPLNDSDNTLVNITLTDLDYDISDPENISADDEQFLSELPHEVTVSLEMNTIPQEGEIDQFIIANAAEQTGLPIKNAKIKSVSVNLLNDKSKDEAVLTEENNTFNVYAFFDGQLKDEASDLLSEDEAITKAKDFINQYENAGANFQVIVTKVSDGFEDFDKLVFQYPELNLEDESLEEETQEPLSNEMLDYMLNNDVVCKFWNDGEEPVFSKLYSVWDREVHSAPYETEEHQLFQHVALATDDEEDTEDIPMHDPEELPDSRDYGLEDTLAMYHNAGIDG